MPDNKSSEKSPTKNQLKRLSIEEWHRTGRTIVISGAVVGCVYIGAGAVVKLMDKPPWLAALSAVLAVIGAGGVQTPIIIRYRKYIQDWTRKNLTLIAQMQSRQDPRRTSSGLQEDGTDPTEPRQ